MVISRVFQTIYLRVTSYESLLIRRVTSCVLDTSYELLFLTIPYKLVFTARVTSYFLRASYDLLVITRVSDTFYKRVTKYELLFASFEMDLRNLIQ